MFKRITQLSQFGPMLVAIALAMGVDVALPRGVHAEQEMARGWCQEEQEVDGWWHDFDLLQPSGHECYDGSPNSWHMNSQKGKCGDYHTPSMNCIF